jgi:hypothetical protein
MTRRIYVSIPLRAYFTKPSDTILSPRLLLLLINIYCNLCSRLPIKFLTVVAKC